MAIESSIQSQNDADNPRRSLGAQPAQHDTPSGSSAGSPNRSPSWTDVDAITVANEGPRRHDKAMWWACHALYRHLSAQSLEQRPDTRDHLSKEDKLASLCAKAIANLDCLADEFETAAIGIARQLAGLPLLSGRDKYSRPSDRGAMYRSLPSPDPASNLDRCRDALRVAQHDLLQLCSLANLSVGECDHVSSANDQDNPRGEPATNPQEIPASAASPGSGARIATFQEMWAHWRGPSGQLWRECERVGSLILLIPEYAYDDSATKDGRMWMSEQTLADMNFVEVRDGGPPWPSGAPVTAPAGAQPDRGA